MNHILRCQNCHSFSMGQDCNCGGKAIVVHPAKYTPDDKYGVYRRKVKELELLKKGLL